MVSMSRLETKIVTSIFIHVIGRLRQFGQEFNNYLTNLFRALDGNPSYYNFGEGCELVFSRIDGIDYQSAENRLITSYFPPKKNIVTDSIIFNPETGRYE